MIEHDPWIGSHYQSGLDGQRIAIVGYSDYCDPPDFDRKDFSKAAIRDVISGAQKGDAFFSRIRSYFNFKDTDTVAFWNRVIYFNFLPNCIGSSENRYDYGTIDQIGRGKERFLRIIRKKKPHKVFVFTTKGWEAFPLTREEQATNTLLWLGSEFPKFSWGTYDADGSIVMAFGLKHPQYANSTNMRKTVEHILRMPVASR
jgi:hypothetical protein